MSRFTDRTGETIISKNGMKATIITYRNSRDIDVQFENNLIVKHRSYDSFKKGIISTRDRRPKNEKIGLTSIATNGQLMTIIDYRKSTDIDVQFEDGTVINNCLYSCFRKGSIKNPNSNNTNSRVDRIGETSIHKKTGQLMTIIAYRNTTDIDVQFEDGVISYNKEYRNFQNGMIARPEHDNYNKLGETNIANNGQKMTIIRYNNWKDIDVQFEDGTIVKNKLYNCFRLGTISNPNINIEVYRKHNYDYIINRKKKFIGQTTTNKDGHIITIIEYNNTNDIIVKFDDNVIKKTTYKQFLKKSVQYPINRIGKTSINTNGQKMTIIAYRTSDDIDIQFDDGTIVYNKKYNSFICGYIRHPFPYQINNILIEKPAYICNNIGNFYCTCTKCNHKDIWTIEEAKNHICKE